MDRAQAVSLNVLCYDRTTLDPVEVTRVFGLCELLNAWR